MVSSNSPILCLTLYSASLLSIHIILHHSNGSCRYIEKILFNTAYGADLHATASDWRVVRAQPLWQRGQRARMRHPRRRSALLSSSRWFISMKWRSR